MAYQPLPLDLVAALPELPFPVYVQRSDRMVLYAAAGTDPRSLVERARAGLRVHVAAPDPASFRRLLVVMLARALESPAEPVRDRGRRAAAVSSALLRPLFGVERSIDRAAFAAAQAAVDLLTSALVRDPLLARALIGGHAPAGSLDAGSPATRRLARRAVDGLACAVAMWRELGHGDHCQGTTVLELGRGAAFRDVGLSRVRHDTFGRQPRHRLVESLVLGRHPIVGLEIIAAALGSTPAWAPLVALHHERIDGSGQPRGLRGDELSRPVQIVGLADAFASLVAPDTWGSVRSTTEAVPALRFALRGRFDDDVSEALLGLLGSGRLLADGRPRAPGPPTTDPSTTGLARQGPAH